MFPDIQKARTSLKPGIEFELIPAIGQNMSTIADNSVDAVSVIHVFCTISDVDEALDEILRILKRTLLIFLFINTNSII
jgi:ubiquinone/menaquinone biosynthesis C-methylase UbiE